MSEGEDSNGRTGGAPADEGVLSKLPHTRAQRSSPRRAAARRAAGAGDELNEGAGGDARARKTPPARPAKARGKASPTPRTAARRPPAAAPNSGRTRSDRVSDDVPRQGFESEMDRAKGPVQPPGGAELVASAAEIVTDLARSGVSTGERLLRDVLGRLPL